MRAGSGGTAAQDTNGCDTRYASDPLTYLRFAQERHRGLLTLLDRIGEADGSDLGLAAPLLAYFEDELPVHDADEWEDLLPLLRRRAEPGDGMDDLLARLRADSAASRGLLDGVSRLLSRLRAGGPRLSDAERALLRDFAAKERRVLILEHAVTLPLSRARLTGEDLRSLSLRMAARRGLCLLPAGPEPGGPEPGGRRAPA